MSAEYMLKMEVLRRKREDLTARRQEIERRIALREATAAEYSAIALQSCKQKWKSTRASAIAAKKRNDELIREVREAQRKIDEVYVRTMQKLWPSDNQLELEKARYVRKVEELYPAWQEKMQAVRIQTLRELEHKKRTIEKRRYLAKKTFETEQTLDDLIQQTSHEIGLAENLEKNEAFEREVLRSQSAIQAMRLDESIREHATGARMYMKQQAFEQLTTAQQVDSDVEDKIFETFSPRGAVQAMRQANNAIAFVESANNNAEHSSQRPQRSQSIIIPASQHRTRSAEEQLPDPYLDTQPFVDKPIASARAWARSGLPEGPDKMAYPSSIPQSNNRSISQQEAGPKNPKTASSSEKKMEVDSNDHLETIEMRITPLAPAPANETHSSSATCKDEHAAELVAAFHKLSENAGYSTIPQIAISQGEQSIDGSDTAFTKPLSQAPTHRDDHELSALKASFTALSASNLQQVAHENPQAMRNHHVSILNEANYQWPLADSRTNEVTRGSTDSAQHTDSKPVISVSAGAGTSDGIEEKRQQPSMTHPIQTDKFVEVKRQGSPPKPGELFIVEDSSIPLEYESNNFHPSKPDALSISVDDRPDLSLNLINSFESNQSSAMDFSVGKLLQTPVKHTPNLITSEDVERQPSPTSTGVAIDPPQNPDMLAYRESSTDRSNATPETTSERIASFENQTGRPVEVAPSDPQPTRTTSFDLRQHSTQPSARSTLDIESSLVFSSLDSTSVMGSPAKKLEDDTMIESMSDFGSPLPMKKSPPAQKDAAREDARSSPGISPPQSPTDDDQPVQALPSLVAALSMPERLKALTALIARVEESANDGEQLGTSTDNEAARDTKRELLRMAVSGRKAQINFFGSDVCFELVVDLARELGPVLFPAKAFEGILSDQKMKKVHQNSKEKEADMWKALASHIKQLHTAKAMPVAALVDVFSSAFLSHDPSNQRSLRKLRELLFSLCGASETTTVKDAFASSPQTEAPPKESDQPRGGTSLMERETPTPPQMPTLLQTAFLQAGSPNKTKTYGIAASSFKKKSSSDDVLKSMASTPTRLSQKLMRGGKMGDYSEFEEEDEVDLENLIGSKPSMGAIHNTNTPVAARAGFSSRSGGAASSSTRLGGMRDDKDDFDVDF